MSINNVTGYDSIEKTTSSSFSWTRRKIVVLVSLCFVYVFLYGAVTVLQPFYPIEASRIGVSESIVGILFATYPLLAFFVAPWFGSLIPMYGSRFILLIGHFLSGMSMILFGFCGEISDKALFIALSFSLRVTFALGGVACETSVMAIMIEEFSDKLGIVMGILETFSGVGYCTGPVLGGILYSAGGFKLPFMIFGSVMAAAVPVLFVFLNNVQGSGNSVEGSASMLKAARIPGVFMLSVSLTTSGITTGFQEPILGPHLKQQMGLNAIHIGLVFLIMSGAYAIVTPGIGWIGDRTQWYRPMIVMGFTGVGVAYLLLGPAPFLTFFLPTREVWLPCVSMLMNGVWYGFFFVSLMPELINTARANGMPDNVSSSGVLAGIFSGMKNLGLAIGPSLAGVLVQHVGFQWATAVAGFICFGQALFVGVFTLCERKVSRQQS